MRSFRPPRATGLCPPAPPLTAPLGGPSADPTVEAPTAPTDVVHEAPPSPRMDCTPLLLGVMRSAAAQVGTVALICEDEMLRGRMRRDLEEDGFAVAAASSGPALIPLLVGRRPSLMIVHDDVVDPEPFELCGALRDDPALCSVEVLLLTRHSSVDTRRVAFHAGAADLVMLPYLRSELRARVGLRLELSRLRRETAGDDAEERVAG